MKAFADYGLRFEDPILLSVLLKDSDTLNNQLTKNPSATLNEYSFTCAYTPIDEASLLHICAEFNHVQCAEILVSHGADINKKAGKDEFGFGDELQFSIL